MANLHFCFYVADYLDMIVTALVNELAFREMKHGHLGQFWESASLYKDYLLSVIQKHDVVFTVVTEKSRYG